MKKSAVSFIFLFIGVFSFCYPMRAEENPCSFSGYLWGSGAVSTFEVYSDTPEASLVIDWPRGTCDFWVRATGEDRNVILIDQSLSSGDVLTLTGSGIYYFIISSRWGTGCWEATVKHNKN